MKYIILNKWDRSLMPIWIKLPKPPKEHLIDGYGLPIEQQVFKKQVYPEKLKQLEKTVEKHFSDLREMKKSNQEPYSVQRYIHKLWKELTSNTRLYAEEIQWIKRQHYFIRNGYWCFIEGEPTYIPGDYFFYLNYWTIDDVAEVEFRFRDRDQFLAYEYFSTTDENEMYVKTGSRTFYGTVYPKHRRDGATHKSLVKMYCKSAFSDCTSIISAIQSHSGQSAEEIYTEKFLNAFRNIPFMFKLMWSGLAEPKEEMNFASPNYLLPRESVYNKILPATTANRQFFDSKKLHFGLFDEEGKTVESDIFDGWSVIKPTMATGNGTTIIGYSEHPSTVADMVKKGGKSYLKMLEMSKFYERDSVTGQTPSGLCRLFSPCIDGLEGHIDIFGKAVINDPKEEDLWRLKKVRRDADGKLFGARRFIMQKRETLKKIGTQESSESLIKDIKLHPMEYLECFGSLGGGVGFDNIAIKERLEDIMRMKQDGSYPVRRGYFVWDIPERGRFTAEDFVEKRMHYEEGVTDTAKVVWIPDDNGNFHIYKHPEVTNKRRVDTHGVSHPENPADFTSSIDTYTFYQKQDKNGAVTARQGDSKKGTSDGGWAIFREYNPSIDPIGTPLNMKETERFYGAYRARPYDNKVFAEECLMANVYFGGLCNIEMNIKDAYNHYVLRKFNGYLMYMIREDGKSSTEPGFVTGVEVKQKIFTSISSHIKYNIQNEYIDIILSEWDDISDIEEMKYYDLITVTGGCLIGSKSKHREYAVDRANKNVDKVKTRPAFFTYYDF